MKKTLFAVALAAMVFFSSTAHAQTARVNVGGLKAGEQYDRFIVQYRADAGVTQLAAARDRVQRAVAASPAAYAAGAPSVSHPMAPGGYVVRSSRPMSLPCCRRKSRRNWCSDRCERRDGSRYRSRRGSASGWGAGPE